MITCTFENGAKSSLRHCIVNGMLIKDGKILLVRRALHLTNPNKLGLVGGFVNRDETLVEAIARETLEETGYQSKIIKLLEIIDNPKRKNEDRQNIAFIYLLQPLEMTGKPDNESSEIVWTDLNNLPSEN